MSQNFWQKELREGKFILLTVHSPSQQAGQGSRTLRQLASTFRKQRDINTDA